MKLEFLALETLVVSKSNMRHTTKAPDIADILPSVRARGVLVPILVRPTDRGSGDDTGAADRYEIIAGRRRHAAASAVAFERRDKGAEVDAMPCAIIEAGDDAAALEASLIENIARLDADEVTRWETFTALVRKGRSVEELSTTFGLPELMIRRTLALGNLLPRIRHLYQRGEMDGTTVRHLTLATKTQQRAWLALLDDEAAYAPYGHQLKSWLFGGQSIPTGHALFDLADFEGGIVADLFGDGGYFADADAFWTAQDATIAARRAAYLDAGWSDVVILPPPTHFAAWEHEKTPKRKGGRVYIDVRANGEVVFHEGYLNSKDARKRRHGGERDAGGATIPAAARAEVSGPMQTYIDLHRHAAVRADLLGVPGVALRLMLAHVLAGSSLWRVSVEPRTARSDLLAESTQGSPAETAFDAARRPLLGSLGMAEDEGRLTGYADDARTVRLFWRLLDLPDRQVMAMITVAMGETLVAGGVIVEALGMTLGTDMARWWEVDDAFFETLRDRAVLGAVLVEVAGERIAEANAGETGKTLKAIIRAHLGGLDGRAKVEGWVPRWMRFAPSAYTERGGVGTVTAAERLDAIRAGLDEALPHGDPDDLAPGAADPDRAAAVPPDTDTDRLAA